MPPVTPDRGTPLKPPCHQLPPAYHPPHSFPSKTQHPAAPQQHRHLHHSLNPPAPPPPPPPQPAAPTADRRPRPPPERSSRFSRLPLEVSGVLALHGGWDGSGRARPRSGAVTRVNASPAPRPLSAQAPPPPLPREGGWERMRSTVGRLPVAEQPPRREAARSNLVCFLKVGTRSRVGENTHLYAKSVIQIIFSLKTWRGALNQCQPLFVWEQHPPCATVTLFYFFLFVLSV